MPKKGSTETKKIPPVKLPIPAVPKVNRAIYLGPGAYVDTGVAFSSFFNGDHTLTAWFMPRYVYAYEGPIFAENGSGLFAVGQGHYHSGNTVKDADGNRLAGDPVFFLRVGNLKQLYLVPHLLPDRWHHLAVVRAANVFKLYLDGQYVKPVEINKDDPNNVVVTPVADLNANQMSSGDPSESTLRLGRRTSGTSDSQKKWQFYGLIDDAAVFSKALSQAEISSIFQKRRLSGTEPSLFKGWCFDAPEGAAPLPAKLATAHTAQAGAVAAKVSVDRKAADASAMRLVDFVGGGGTSQQDIQLPFLAGDAWKVTQGYSNPTGSHSGNAAFCLDLSRAGKSSGGADVLSASSAFVSLYIDDGSKDLVDDQGNVVREGNSFKVRQAEDEYLVYMHLLADSIPDEFKEGTFDPESGFFVVDEADLFQPIVNPAVVVGKVGPKGNHLHLAMTNGQLDGVTVPMVISKYEVLENGASWTPRLRTQPQNGEEIRRP